MIDEYVEMCDTVFAGVGVQFSAEQLAHLRTVLEGQLAAAFAGSQRSDIVISYDSPVGVELNYHVRAEWRTIGETYNYWVATREPPLFGTEPDARVWALAGEATDPRSYRVLDIGAGTGRNALALARRGHPVDAVEMTSAFADIIRAEAQRHVLDVHVIERDVFATSDDLRSDYQLIVLSEVVPDFRTTEQVRGLFELAAHCLEPGGRLVFNVFLARPGYNPDDAARELAQQTYSMIFTRDEMARAAAGYPSSSLPTTRSTSTRKPICPRAPGRPPAGTPIGPVASTCSTSSMGRARSRCAGWSTRSRPLAHRPSLQAGRRSTPRVATSRPAWVVRLDRTQLGLEPTRPVAVGANLKHPFPPAVSSRSRSARTRLKNFFRNFGSKPPRTAYRSRTV